MLEYAYYFAVLLFAGLALPYSRVALVVLLVWIAGQYAWLTNIPLPPVYVGLHAAAFIASCLVVSRDTLSVRAVFSAAAAVLFIPLLAVDIAEIASMINPRQAWYARVVLGLMQLVMLWPAAGLPMRYVRAFQKLRKGHISLRLAA